MKDREGEDFSDVIVDLGFKNKDIVSVPRKFDNATGVYHNPEAKEGYRYAVAFATVDNTDATWVEIFAARQDGTKMVLGGRVSSAHLGSKPGELEIKRHAIKMIERWLDPQRG